MDKDKLNKDMNKMFQNKKFVNCLIVLLVIIFLWLAVSNFLGNDSNVSDKNNAPKGAQEVSTNDGGMTSKELLSYEEDQKKQLEDILSKMSGVGQVVVTIHFESGETQVPATNSSTQTSETQEEDTNGGTRLTKQETEGTTVVMKSDSNSSEPFITKTYKPAVTGVLIVAEGGQPTNGHIPNGTAQVQNGNGREYQTAPATHETFCFDPEDENDRELLREDPYAEYPDFPAEYRMKDEAQVEMVYC